MLAELGGDASLLSIEVAPPADGIQPALRTLPCLQLAEFFLTDATGQPVAFEWLGKLLGSPGGSELPPEGAAAAAAAAAEDAGAAATAAAAAAAGDPLVRLELESDADSKKRKSAGPRPVKEKKEKLPKAPKAPKEPKEPKERAPRKKAKATGGKGSESKVEADSKEGGGGEEGCEEEGEEEGEGETDEEPEMCNWAQCDRCEKWRRLPAGPEYEETALPEKWFCYMNPNTQRNSCEKPEERMARNEVWGADEEEEDEQDEQDVDEEEKGEGEPDLEKRTRAVKAEWEDDPRTTAAKFKAAQEEAQRVALLQIEREAREAEAREEEAREAEAREAEAAGFMSSAAVGADHSSSAGGKQREGARSKDETLGRKQREGARSKDETLVHAIREANATMMDIDDDIDGAAAKESSEGGSGETPTRVEDATAKLDADLDTGKAAKAEEASPDQLCPKEASMAEEPPEEAAKPDVDSVPSSDEVGAAAAEEAAGRSSGRKRAPSAAALAASSSKEAEAKERDAKRAGKTGDGAKAAGAKTKGATVKAGAKSSADVDSSDEEVAVAATAGSGVASSAAPAVPSPQSAASAGNGHRAEAASEAATAAVASVGSTSAWAAALLKKKQEQEKKKQEEEAEAECKRLERELSAAKLDPKQLAIARRPVGHMRMRGILVPGGFEGDLTAWRYVVTAPVTGWALQHAGQLRLQSLWLRTPNAWYWLRSAPPSFYPASIGRMLWEPPGAAPSAPLAEPLLLGSPVLGAYAVPTVPPSRGAGLAALPEVAMAPFAAADAADLAPDLAPPSSGARGPASFRVSTFFFVDAAGKPTDLFTALPQGLALFAPLEKGPPGATAPPCVQLVGQLMPAHHPKGSGAEGSGADADGAGRGVAAAGSLSLEEVPARLWMRSLAVHEWRLQIETAATLGSKGGGSGGGASLPDGAANPSKVKIWVRSTSSWFVLLKPRLDVSWQPPGTRERPIDDRLLPSSIATIERSPLPAPASVARRILSQFSITRLASGEPVNLFEVLPTLGQPNSEVLGVLGTLGPPLSATAAAAAAAGSHAAASAAGGVWVLTTALLKARLDYSVAPPALWVQTASALYRLTQPAEAYLPLYKPPGGNRNNPMPEVALIGETILPVYERKDTHPFESAKGVVVPVMMLADFELCDGAGGARSLIATLPEGTLRAAQKAQKAAAVPSAAGADELDVYVKARVLPNKEGGSRPWVWAGPIRAWSTDLDRRGTDGKLLPGLWLCTKTVAYFAPLARASSMSELHTRSWLTGDGLLTRYAAELLAGCREHRDPRTAVKLFNTICSSAWSRLPAETVKYGVRRETLLEKHVTTFVIEALEDAGYAEFGKRINEQRVEQMVRKERSAGAAMGTKPAEPPALAVPPRPKPVAAVEELPRVTDKTGVVHGGGGGGGGGGGSGGGGGGGGGGATKRTADGSSIGAPAREPKQPKLSNGSAKGAAETSAETSAKPSSSKQPAISAAVGGSGAAGGASGGVGGGGVSSGGGKASGAKEPDDVEVARTMLGVLRRAHAPLSLAQVALACKDALPLSMWNLARWLQAVGRALKARPRWFASIGSDMLGVGPEPGIEPDLAPAPPAAAATAGGSGASGGPGAVSGASAYRAGPGAAAGGASGFGSVGGFGAGFGVPESQRGGPGAVARGGPGAVVRGGPGAVAVVDIEDDEEDEYEEIPIRERRRGV